MTTSQQLNYHLLATSVGELLKYETTVNEIGRVAGAIFSFISCLWRQLDKAVFYNGAP